MEALAKYKTEQQEISLLEIEYLTSWLSTAKKIFVMMKQPTFPSKMHLQESYQFCDIILTVNVAFQWKKIKSQILIVLDSCF